MPALRASLPGMHPSVQHPEHSEHCSSLLRLKKMSRDKTPSNLKYKPSDAWLLGNDECGSAPCQGMEPAFLPATQTFSKQMTSVEVGAKKQKRSVQQRRNLPHFHEKNTENKKRCSLMTAAGCLS